MPRVEPDGPIPCKLAIVGEAPAAEEVRQGRGFVGPSGKLLWPLIGQYTGLSRQDFWVTNLSKEPLDDEAAEKMSPEQFRACKVELFEEMDRVRPHTILAVGALASEALLQHEYRNMKACNAMRFETQKGRTVIPCIHPAMTLRGGGEDSLAWTADAIKSLIIEKPRRIIPSGGEPLVGNKIYVPFPAIAIDTEGTPESPEMLTWSDGVYRYVVTDVPTFWATVQQYVGKIVYHNAPWDWAVMEAMGIKDPHLFPYTDTMEAAYLKQVEPQGLKDLGYRHFGIWMKGWEEVVMPHYDKMLREVATTVVENVTTRTTVGKNGKPLKKPKVYIPDLYKPLQRALKSDKPDLLRKRAAHLTAPPSLGFHVPRAEAYEYATLDSFVTFNLAKWWRLV